MRAKDRRSDWSDIQYVIATAKLGSFHSAALALETNQSTVGRRVARLEAYLGTKIFERHATGMRLTAAGKLLYEKAMRMEEAADDMESSLLALDSRLSGTVRVFAPEGVAHLWLTRVLAEFGRVHPAVQIDLVTHREWLDLFSLETDIAVFIERPKNPRLVAAKTARVDHSLFISKSYEEQFGRPHKVEDLGEHRFIDYVPYHVCAGLAWWTKSVLPAQRVQMVIDSAAVYLAAVRNGIGVGLLPNFYKRAAPDLIALPLPTGCSVHLWLVTRPIANKYHRTRILLKYLRDQFNRDLESWFGA
ncbi:MAG TPA: LysR family transcriptional regulator [Steroidobacteraceae bacterium]|nr:LysR family transcriptional regulator [Steroidobacteraceae bacterium]